MMPEANILRNYLDWVLSLPWDKVSEDRLDIGEAAKILDHDHYGLKRSRNVSWNSWRFVNYPIP